jgi:hypothetical protein
MEDVGILYGHLIYVFYSHWVYFIDIWHVLWLFGIFWQFCMLCGNFVCCVVILYILW